MLNSSEDIFEPFAIEYSKIQRTDALSLWHQQ